MMETMKEPDTATRSPGEEHADPRTRERIAAARSVGGIPHTSRRIRGDHGLNMIAVYERSGLSPSRRQRQL